MRVKKNSFSKSNCTDTTPISSKSSPSDYFWLWHDGD